MCVRNTKSFCIESSTQQTTETTTPSTDNSATENTGSSSSEQPVQPNHTITLGFRMYDKEIETQKF